MLTYGKKDIIEVNEKLPGFPPSGPIYYVSLEEDMFVSHENNDYIGWNAFYGELIRNGQDEKKYLETVKGIKDQSWLKNRGSKTKDFLAGAKYVKFQDIKKEMEAIDEYVSLIPSNRIILQTDYETSVAIFDYGKNRYVLAILQRYKKTGGKVIRYETLNLSPVWKPFLMYNYVPFDKYSTKLDLFENLKHFVNLKKENIVEEMKKNIILRKEYENQELEKKADRIIDEKVPLEVEDIIKKMVGIRTSLCLKCQKSIL